ncbi:MAG: BON domain-containing protein [Ardenticatenaceae bacterium]|nr:BON domain-containing protein [Ardenticatenaceae bacterium]
MDYDDDRYTRGHDDEESERWEERYERSDDMGYRETPTWSGRYSTYGESWIVPGPHTGRGPQSYRRSDERIREDVNDRLAQHGRIDASNITVSVNDGLVTLDGTVSSRWAKRRAEDVAESVSGVWDVQNNLRLEERIGRRSEGFAPGTTDRSQVQVGMQVVGLDGADVGRVKEVRDDDLLVDRPFDRDVYVPFDAIQEISGNWIVLTVSADRVDSMGWASPPLFGGPSTPYYGYGAYGPPYYGYGPYGPPPYDYGYYGPYYGYYGRPY